jgi:DNA-binding MarR family transcriptional regulator
MDEVELFTLARIGNSIHNLNKLFEKESDLSLVQWCLLKKLIDMPATSAVSLARSVGVHASTLTQTLRRLERKGFVSVLPDPHDSRRKMVSLTRSGRSALLRSDESLLRLRLRLSAIKSELIGVQAHLAAHVEHGDSRSPAHFEAGPA